MKIREAISYIRNLLKDYSRTPEYTDQFIWSLIVKKRSVYFNRELEKNKLLNPKNYQLFCFPLELSNLNQCSNIVPLNCPIKKTINKIPSIITNRNNLDLEVRNVLGERLSEIKFNELQDIKYNPIKKNKISWFLLNNYIYIYGSLDIEVITIEATWEDLTELNINITGCQSIFDVEFSIDNKSFDIISQMVLETLIPTEQIIQDNTNDSNSEIK